MCKVLITDIEIISFLLGSNIVPIALRQLEKQDDDQTEDKVTGSNSNYDSSEGK